MSIAGGALRDLEKALAMLRALQGERDRGPGSCWCPEIGDGLAEGVCLGCQARKLIEELSG